MNRKAVFFNVLQHIFSAQCIEYMKMKQWNCQKLLYCSFKKRIIDDVHINHNIWSKIYVRIYMIQFINTTATSMTFNCVQWLLKPISRYYLKLFSSKVTFTDINIINVIQTVPHVQNKSPCLRKKWLESQTNQGLAILNYHKHENMIMGRSNIKYRAQITEERI